MPKLNNQSKLPDKSRPQSKPPDLPPDPDPDPNKPATTGYTSYPQWGKATPSSSLHSGFIE